MFLTLFEYGWGWDPEIPVAPGEEHWLLDTSLDEVSWPCSHSRAMPWFIGAEMG